MKKLSLFTAACGFSLITSCFLDTHTINNYIVSPLELKAQGSLIFNFDVKAGFLNYDGFHYDIIKENDFDIFGSQDDELIPAFHYTLIALKQSGIQESAAPIGTAQFFIFDRYTSLNHKEKIGLIKKLHIQHDSHNHKFNSFILETVIQFLKLKGCSTIITDLVLPEDIATLQFKKDLEFYKRHGFAIAECKEEDDVLRLSYNNAHQGTLSSAELHKYLAMAHHLMAMEEHIVQSSH